MKKILIATIPGMIERTDVKCLGEICKIDWLICDHISEKELAEKSREYDYMMLNYDVVENLTSDFYDGVKGGNLEVISTDITGMSWANPLLAKKAGIKLLNTANYCTESVAEYSIAQILLYAKRFNMGYKDIRDGREPEARKTFNILGKTIGIIGLGNIGTRVAEIARGMGFKVIGYNYVPVSVEGVELVDLETLFRSSDFISLHLKTVPGKTEGIIDEKLLSLCKRNCFFENQADEKLINMGDLKNALEKKMIAGYGAVRSSENEELEGFDDVILSPANAWNSDESMENLKRIWMNNIIEFDKGNIINLVEE